MGLYDFSLYDLIARNARLYADRPAWREVDGDDPFTFVQIKLAVDQLAGALQTAGCQKGDRIGVLGKNCLEFFSVYGAAAALGAIVLPVNWRLSADEAAYALNDGKPRWVFADDSNPEWTKAVRSKLGDEVRFFNLQSGQGAFDDLEPHGDTAGFTPAEVSCDDGFVIIHTAAITGNPRGALLSQGNLLCCHMHLMHGIGMTSEDVHVNALPLFHVAGLFMVFSAFHAGCLNINLPKFDPALIVRLVAGYRAVFMFTFAPMLNAILDFQKEKGSDISALRAVIGLDAPEVIERYQTVSGGTFYCMYGQSETSMLATLSAYNQAPGSAGRPISLADVQLLDDNDRPVAVGEVGEIAMRGPMVFKGYWGLKEDNLHTFRNGWHHTGDLGRMDGAGYLWYAGRKADKELIKPGGENVYPAEVEKVVLEHPQVEKVVVFGVPDPKWKEGIKAVCLLSRGAKLDPQDLIDFIGQRIARYKRPRYIEYVETLPLLPDGAIDRDKVKEMFGGDQI
ncbi:MAG: AMP-binding protein [Desulfobacteraceae bacterium]|jgi:long-chain acyl-CoA synthetase